MGITLQQWRTSIGRFRQRKKKLNSSQLRDKEMMSQSFLSGKKSHIWTILRIIVVISAIVVITGSKELSRVDDMMLKSHEEQLDQLVKVNVEIPNKLQDGSNEASGLVERILLILAGVEQNPGPDTIYLQTKVEKCLVCQVGNIEIQQRSRTKEPMAIYGRNGMREVIHLEGRCKFRNENFSCNSGYYHGYMTYRGATIWNDDALNEKTIVTSDQTGFDIDYLVEIIDDITISSTTFEAAAKKFNRFHNTNLPFDVMEKRNELYEKRISHAIKLYSYLEYSQRYNIPEYQIMMKDLDSVILERKEMLQNKFRENYTVKHKCDRPGCRLALVIDGGLKPHRAICGAKACGVKVMKETGATILTGCPGYS